MAAKKMGKPTGRKVVAKTANNRQTVEPAKKDALGHIAGSRKGEVHAAFAKSGDDAAFKLGVKLGLKESTLRSWFGAWRRTPGAKKAATKKPATAKANNKATAAA